MFSTIIRATAMSAAFAVAVGASAVSARADTSTMQHPYDQARCQEAEGSGDAFLVQQFCDTWESQPAVNSGRPMQPLSLEQMNCMSSNESNDIPCATKGRI